MVPTTIPASSGDVREVHRVGTVPPRFGRIVLVPGSPDATPDSQGAPSSLMSNRFAVLADEPTVADEGREESIRVGRRPSLLVIVSQNVPAADSADGVQHHAIDTPIASDNGTLHDDNVSVAKVRPVGEFVPRQAARRLVLVPHQDGGGTPRSAQDSDVDEMSVPGADSDNGSVVSGVEEVLDLENIQAKLVGFRAALRSTDDVDLNRIFQQRANVMKSVP